MGVFKLLSHISFNPPVPTADFSGKCVIVTGANRDLGKEAIKQFVRGGAPPKSLKWFAQAMKAKPR